MGLLDTTKGAFGRALLKKLGLSDAPAAKKACVLVALEDICSLLFLDDFELADRYPGGGALSSMIYGGVIKDVPVEALMRCATGDVDTTTLLGAAGVTAEQLKLFVREYVESTPQQNVTYYTVAMCCTDLDRATHIEVFEHTREALLKYYAGYDTELLGKQIVYEVTVAASVAVPRNREIHMKSVESVRDVGSLLKFLYPDTPMVSGSGYWVEGCVLGSSGNLVVGLDMETTLRIANHSPYTGDVELGEALKDKVVYTVFYETDRTALYGTMLYLPECHVLNKVPLGTVRDIFTDSDV